MRFKKWLTVLSSALLVFALAGCTSEEAGTDESAGSSTQTSTSESAAVTETAFMGEYIVDADYVKAHYEDDNVILLDARGEELAKEGTIAGAVTTTWQNLSNTENATTGDMDWGLILEPEVLAERLGELGLPKDKEIILFAEGPNGWGEDGRILWTLRAAGYENVKMVNGGLAALQAAGLPEAKDVTKLESVTVAIDELDYTHVINTAELEENYDDYVVIDARADEEYEGQVLYGEAKGGHLPGAIHVKFTDLFDDKGALKSNEEITALVEAAGIKKTDKIVVYCTAGIRSAYMQLILEMSGFEDSKNYDGSYHTWAANNEVES